MSSKVTFVCVATDTCTNLDSIPRFRVVESLWQRFWTERSSASCSTELTQGKFRGLTPPNERWPGVWVYQEFVSTIVQNARVLIRFATLTVC